MPQDRFDTLAAFLLDAFRRVPAEGDALSIAGWRFSVTRMDGNRIARVRATPEEAGDGATDAP